MVRIIRIADELIIPTEASPPEPLPYGLDYSVIKSPHGFILECCDEHDMVRFYINATSTKDLGSILAWRGAPIVALEELTTIAHDESRRLEDGTQFYRGPASKKNLTEVFEAYLCEKARREKRDRLC
jgi:hypothetical protein